MRISVIFTGGTIGSRLCGDVISTGEAPYALLEAYKARNPQSDVCFSCSEPYRILSENLSAGRLLQLVDEVKRVLREKPAGIIITHGTDTLQYTAAILGYLFAQAAVPIVLVSAAYVLSDARTNGHANFEGAVQFIRQAGQTGVFVSYQNEDGRLYIHRGTRLQGVIPFSADLYSVGGCFGEVKENHFTPHEKPLPAGWGGSLFPLEKTVRLSATGGIYWLSSHPGQQFTALPEGTKAVLLNSYHSGTLTADEELKKLAGEAAAKNIPVFVTGLLPGAEYETVDTYRRMGILPLPPAAPIAQYCRLWLILSNGLDPIHAMQPPVAYDRRP